MGSGAVLLMFIVGTYSSRRLISIIPSRRAASPPQRRCADAPRARRADAAPRPSATRHPGRRAGHRAAGGHARRAAPPGRRRGTAQTTGPGPSPRHRLEDEGPRARDGDQGVRAQAHVLLPVESVVEVGHPLAVLRRGESRVQDLRRGGSEGDEGEPPMGDRAPTRWTGGRARHRLGRRDRRRGRPPARRAAGGAAVDPRAGPPAPGAATAAHPGARRGFAGTAARMARNFTSVGSLKTSFHPEENLASSPWSW